MIFHGGAEMDMEPEQDPEPITQQPTNKELISIDISLLDPMQKKIFKMVLQLVNENPLILDNFLQWYQHEQSNNTESED